MAYGSTGPSALAALRAVRSVTTNHRSAHSSAANCFTTKSFNPNPHIAHILTAHILTAIAFTTKPVTTKPSTASRSAS